MAWGGGTFNDAMNNELPGTYININVTSNPTRINTNRGYLACPIELPWGSDEDVIVINADDYKQHSMELLGLPAGSKELLYIEEMLQNASVLYLYRVNSGLKASGKYGEAACSGEIGNDITIVIEEDPDNPGDDQPETAAAIVKGAGNTYSVAYTDLYDETPDIRVTKGEISVSKSGNWTSELVGEGTYKVTILDTMEPGKYKIEAWLQGGDAALSTFEFEIIAPPATAEITNEGKVYTVTYTNLYDRVAKVTVKDTEKQADVDKDGNWSIVGEGSQFTVTILETILPGSYSVNAELESGEILATESFSIPNPTAEITVTEANDQYSIKYENLGAYQAEVKIKDESQDIEAGEKYFLQGTVDSFTIDINDKLPGGEYTLEARAKHEEETKVLDSEQIVLPKPTAEIVQNTEGASYTVNYTNLRAEKGSVKLKKDGGEITGPEKISTDGENPINVTITKTNLEPGDYTLEAWSTNAEEALKTATFTLKAPTAEITENTEGESYTVNFTDLDGRTGSVKLSKDGVEVSEPEKIQTSGENPINVTITKASLEDGTYKLEAFATGVAEALANKEFTKTTE